MLNLQGLCNVFSYQMKYIADDVSPNRWQAITWATYDPDRWRIYVSPCLKILNVKGIGYLELIDTAVIFNLHHIWTDISEYDIPYWGLKKRSEFCGK